MNEHDVFIRMSQALAEEAAANGNHPFGALLVKDGVVLLTALNTVHTSHDVTAHAELNLVRQASGMYEAGFLADCILYTSTEPCAMCTGGIVWSGIGHIVYSCPAELLGEITGSGRFVVPCRELLGYASRPLTVTGPILPDTAAAFHRRYWPTYTHTSLPREP